MILIACSRLGPIVSRRMANNPNAVPRAGLASQAAGLAILGLLVLTGGEAGAADAPTGSTQTVYLEYRELSSPIVDWCLDLRPQSAPFRKEPDLGLTRVELRLNRADRQGKATGLIGWLINSICRKQLGKGRKVRLKHQP